MLTNSLRAAAAALCLIAAPAMAHDFKKEGLTIDHPTARVNVAGRPSAGYMTIHNNSATADRLIAARSPAFGRIELHTHLIDDAGIMRMRAISAIEAPAGEAVSLEPGGLHLMLFDPTDALGAGTLIPVTLMFETAGEIEIVLLGEKIGRRTNDDRKKGADQKGHSGHTH